MTDTPIWPHIPEDVRAAADHVLASGKINYWTGSETRTFEQEFAAALDVPYALAVANGTLALELALRAYGIGENGRSDEVIVPSRTFIATAGAVVAVGATPIIADIDPETNCLTPLAVAKVTTPRTRAVIPVHLGGYPTDMDALLRFTQQLDGVRVIEDCAQAQGARYRGRAVGSIGDAGCYSFCQEKIMPLGEGGMLVFRDGSDARAAFERAWAYRDHGRSWAKAHDADVAGASSHFRYLNDSFGTNARLTEMQGAMGRVMLAKWLPVWHEQRARNAAILKEALIEVAKEGERVHALTFVDVPDDELARGTEHAYYRLYALLDVGALRDGWTRDRVVDEINLRAADGGHFGGVAQYGSSALIGSEAAFAAAGFVTGFAVAGLAGDAGQAGDALAGAREADERSFAFFVDPGRCEDDMRFAAGCVKAVLKEATGVC